MRAFQPRGAIVDSLKNSPKSQRSLAPPDLDAHFFHARQMGVFLVRRLGLDLPVLHLGAGRSRIRQGKSLGPAVRELPTSQRTGSRLRMGIFGPQSPILAWACGRVYRMEKQRTGRDVDSSVPIS